MFIQENLPGDLSAERLAARFQLSRSHLRQCFKAETGQPLGEYVREMRMRKAKELLETSSLRVKEIAFQVGINDVSHFVRQFARSYGKSPKRYRAEALKNAGARDERQLSLRNQQFGQ